MSFTLEQLAAIDWDGPWSTLDESDRQFFTDELAREVCDTHILSGASVTAVARGGTGNSDSVIYFVHSSPPQIAVAHLTFRQTRETSPSWPAAQMYSTVDDLLSDLPNW